jgi:uncharacterized protein
MTRTLGFVAVLCWMLAIPAHAQQGDVPYLTGRVVDNAEILRPDTRKRIAEALRQHEQRSTNQVAVLTVPTLGGESVEEYAVRVFEHWKLGQKGKDNGVLLLVAPQERRMRVEVGYGLEGVLPDAVAARVIRNVMTPRFKDGDYDGGIAQGVDAIVAQLEGKAAPAAEEPAASSGGEFIKAPAMPLHEKVLFGAFIFGIIGLFTIIGIVTPGMGWFLYLFLIPFWAMFPVIVFGSSITFYILIAYLVGFPIAKLLVSRTDWVRDASRNIGRKGYAGTGGFTWGGGGGSWGSGGGSWSSSSGGGFSGGGGSSGGGGASGSW